MTKRNKNSTSKRGAKGRFLPGNREGLGRPKGSRNKTTLLIEALLEGEAEDLTRALIARAKAGSGVALQLVFDRLAPARKDRCVQIKLPAIGCCATNQRAEFFTCANSRLVRGSFL